MDTSKIQDFLFDNPKTALSVAKEINAYDGSIPAVDVYSLEDLIDMQNPKKLKELFLDFAEAVKENNGFDENDYIRFDEVFQTMEIISEEDLLDEVQDYYIDDIIYGIENLYPANINIYDSELAKIIDTELEHNEDEEE